MSKNSLFYPNILQKIGVSLNNLLLGALLENVTHISQLIIHIFNTQGKSYNVSRNLFVATYLV